jgi:hypothetical protein
MNVNKKAMVDTLRFFPLKFHATYSLTYNSLPMLSLLKKVLLTVLLHSYNPPPPPRASVHHWKNR